MKRNEMEKKIDELFELINELSDYGFYTDHERGEIIKQTLNNYRRIWGK